MMAFIEVRFGVMLRELSGVPPSYDRPLTTRVLRSVTQARGQRVEFSAVQVD